MKQLAIHAGQPRDAAYGAVMTPIYQTSTFAFKGVNEPGISTTPEAEILTRKALEDCLAALEGWSHGFVLRDRHGCRSNNPGALRPGDHLIVTIPVRRDIPPPRKRPAQTRVEVDFVNLRQLDGLRSAFRPNTRAIMDGDADESSYESP